MRGPKKIEIPVEDLTNLTIAECCKKHNCSDSVVSRRRQELGVVPVRRTYETKAIDPKIEAKVVALYYEEGLTLRSIKARYRDLGIAKISQIVRNAGGGGRLSSGRQWAAGWCG